MSSIFRFTPFLFFLFLFASSTALANADAPLSNTKTKLLNMIKKGNNHIKIASNEDPTTTPDITSTASPLEAAAEGASSTPAYVRLVLTLKQKAAERLSTPNAQGNTKKKLLTIIGDALGRPAEGLNITMTIDDIDGKTNPNKKNPKVLLILLITLSSTDLGVKSLSNDANNQSSLLSTQLMQETGADSITVQTSYGFPPSSASDGNPFTSSDGSLFEAYKTLILAVSISIIGIVFLGAIILFLTKTKERRERLLELFRFGGRLRREQNASISTVENKRSSGSKRIKKTSTRHSSGRGNSGRGTNGATTGGARNSMISINNNSTINNENSTINNNTVTTSTVRNQV